MYVVFLSIYLHTKHCFIITQYCFIFRLIIRNNTVAFKYYTKQIYFHYNDLLLLYHWCTCKCNDMQTFPYFIGIQFCTYSTLNLVRPVDQWPRQLAVRFYSKWCIMKSRVGVFTMKFILDMIIVMET